MAMPQGHVRPEASVTRDAWLAGGGPAAPPSLVTGAPSDPPCRIPPPLPAPPLPPASRPALGPLTPAPPAPPNPPPPGPGVAEPESDGGPASVAATSRTDPEQPRVASAARLRKLQCRIGP